MIAFRHYARRRAYDTWDEGRTKSLPKRANKRLIRLSTDQSVGSGLPTSPDPTLNSACSHGQLTRRDNTDRSFLVLLAAEAPPPNNMFFFLFLRTRPRLSVRSSLKIRIQLTSEPKTAAQNKNIDMLNYQKRRGTFPCSSETIDGKQPPRQWTVG